MPHLENFNLQEEYFQITDTFIPHIQYIYYNLIYIDMIKRVFYHKIKYLGKNNYTSNIYWNCTQEKGMNMSWNKNLPYKIHIRIQYENVKLYKKEVCLLKYFGVKYIDVRIM